MSDIMINARWPGRSATTQATLEGLREDPKALEAGKAGLSPIGFEVLLVRDLAGKFSGRRTFIELLEATVPDFYKQVGQHLRAWVPPPPKYEPQTIADEEQKDVPVPKPETVGQPASQIETASTPVQASEDKDGNIAKPKPLWKWGV